MNEVRIKLLWLQNFKGLKQFEISDFGDGISIYGDNATGKTTIFDAFSWLLFGKDSLNSAIFEIKPLTDTGEALHGLEHEVSSTLVTSAGEIELRKVYSEKYTKRRGEAKRTFTGHTVDHFVNGVPCLQKQYNKQVSEICNEDIFRLLTNPRHFNEVMHWQDRRKLLLEVCGDIDDADVIAHVSNLSRFPDILGKHTLDDKRKIINGRRAEINRELQKIPTRIDEISKSIVEVIDSKPENRAKIERYRADKAAAEKTLAAVKAGGGIAEKEKQLAELQAKILVHQNNMAQEESDRLRAQKKELQAADDKAIKSARITENMVADQTNKIKTLSILKETLAELIKERGHLRKSWVVTDATQFIPIEGERICPTCGQDLPADQVERAARLAVEAFNLKKAKDLDAIAEKGHKLQEKITLLENDISEFAQLIKRADKDIADQAAIQDADQKIVDELKARHTKINMSIPQDVELDQLSTQEESIRLEINSLSAGNNEAVLAAESELARINEMLSLLSRDQLQIDANQRVVARIEELDKQERALAEEYENLESDMFVIESFIRTKVSLLEAKINERFKHATFRLFTENINGGLEECCDTTFQGVPYNSTNNGARINLGLDICNTLSNHYGISLPCFIDNAEAVSKIIDTNAQQIRLFVSEADKTLRIKKGA